MLKYLFLFLLSFSANALQTKQEIIDYCTRTYLKEAGNTMVLFCVKTEIEAQKEIKNFAKS